MSGVLPEFMSFAGELADAAGAVIRPLFGTPVAVEIKADASPVTKADREGERVMRELIMQRYPDHGIWGEEFGKHQVDAKYCWVLDPVDGTKSFISGFPTFGTLIGLTRMGVPVLGVIDQPVNKERWIGATGAKATYNGNPASVRHCPSLAQATISTTSPYLFSDTDREKFLKIRAESRYAIYGYDCYAYAKLASGFIDVVIETGLKSHDFCALRPVVEAAGGMMTDWQGKPLTLASDGKVIACGDKKLHTEILNLLNS